jgi:hypothetical protein
MGCAGGHCAKVFSKMQVCCSTATPPQPVPCSTGDGGIGSLTCEQAGGHCALVGADQCPPSPYACPPGRCCIGAPGNWFTCGVNFTCNASTQYCFSGAETAFFLGPGTIQVGCDNLPADCQTTPSCDCILKHFNVGFCICMPTGAGFTVGCSTA